MPARSTDAPVSAAAPAAASSVVASDPWRALRRHTTARIGLGRVGASLPTDEVLNLGLAHAQARDAVHRPLDFAALESALATDGWQVQRVRSQAPDRQRYLLRPDLGRSLSEADAARLGAQSPAELVIVIADGLSSSAVQLHAQPLLAALRGCPAADWARTPVVLAEQGRVAIGDGIGVALRARLAVVLIGERPGLSSPSSLGVYLTYAPRPGRMDSERNCISNVRPEGLSYIDAANTVARLCGAARRLRLTGVGLKDDGPLLTDG